MRYKEFQQIIDFQDKLLLEQVKTSFNLFENDKNNKIILQFIKNHIDTGINIQTLTKGQQYFPISISFIPHAPAIWYSYPHAKVMFDNYITQKISFISELGQRFTFPNQYMKLGDNLLLPLVFDTKSESDQFLFITKLTFSHWHIKQI